MIQHRFLLEPYKGMKTRYTCPQCQQINKSFTRYIDGETGNHINTLVGKCNRESKCGYHYPPKQYFIDTNTTIENTPLNYSINKQLVHKEEKQTSYIPLNIFNNSLKDYDSNQLVCFLNNLFGTTITSELISRYFIGTTDCWNGATVFWQIDIKGKIRTGKIMLYIQTTGKRVKEPYNHINWAHKTNNINDFELDQCFFGEHLLIDKSKPVALVESEKTALIASVYFPKFIWLAVGSLNNLNANKCMILRDRNVVLFPDLGAFTKWEEKANSIEGLKYHISNLLEKKALPNEKNEGLDLADYLVKYDFKEFNEATTEKQRNTTTSQQPVAKPKQQPVSYLKFSSKPKRKAPSTEWNNEIREIEAFFQSTETPSKPILLNNNERVPNIDMLVKNHLLTVKANNGNITFLPYLNRLRELKNKLINGLN